MGCGQSKIENEEAVTRCKERKLFMKDAVSARNAFAAAHSAYAMSLKNTGAALSDYAHGEVVQNPKFVDPTASPAQLGSGAAAKQPFETFVPPPPPLPNFGPGPLQRAASMPEFKPSKVEMKHADAIIEEDGEEMDGYEQESVVGLKHRSRSKRGSGGGGGSSRGNVMMEEAVVMKEERPPPVTVMAQSVPPPPQPTDSTWDFFFSGMDNMQGPHLTEVEEEEQDARASKEQMARRVYDERPKRVEESGKKIDDMVAEKAVAPTPPVEPPSGAVVVKNVKKAKQIATGLGGMEGRRTAKPLGSVNLLQLFIDLDDHFLKASESAHEVSKMLEATRLHYHSNFADNRGHIDHSARVMRVITWNRSFKGLPNADNGKDDSDSEEHETHATVLDKLLAWEKKLYDEVKAGELMKIEYQKKFAALNRHKKHGTNTEALEKAKAAVSHLHTRYIVDMQSLDSTVSEINRLRDDQLYPKLVSLVDGMALMWDTMKDHHENQTRLVIALRSLDISQSPKETSEHHHDRTCQLEVVIKEWHDQFQKLVNYQREYIKSLNSWLKLNLIHIESSLKEKVSSPPRIPNPRIMYLLRAWLDHLDRLPDGIARSAISNFAAVINTIVILQNDEMTLKSKCEDTRKELIKKTRMFEDWYNKYLPKHTNDEGDSERPDGDNDGALAARKVALDLLKKRLEEEEDAYRKQCLQVREKSLFNLKSHLPELFRALTDFSYACSEMYKSLRSIAHRQNVTES
uniref:Nitrate regulatory gene2 protein-like n=1 Tax=Kalanchoe fedtschenkoi TaxID=63787 RepID=A0A7N0UXK7_KALFE